MTYLKRYQYFFFEYNLFIFADMFTEIKEMTLDELLNIDHLKLLYKTEISVKVMKGVDGISPFAFQENSEFTIIQQKCLNGSYKFSSYLERLVSKGAKKYPRILSVATVRDRLTLAVLKEYLNNIYSDCINRKLPNNRIGEIFHYMQNNPNSRYLKTDIKGFYENIDHTILVSILRERITDIRIVSLIEKAIKTPTFPPSTLVKEKMHIINLKGLPQGLAISNILAEIYLSNVDKYMCAITPFYSRYVDDIIIILPKKVNETKKILKKQMSQICLSLNNDKTLCDKVKAGVLFLGYWIDPCKISIPKNKISLFLTRIAGLFTEYEKLYNEINLRPIYFQNDSAGLKQYFLEILNKKITGAKSQTKRYGWIAYYSQITDYSILYRIDKIIKKYCLDSTICGCAVPDDLKSIFRSYFEIKYNSRKSNYIYNYDIINTVLQKRKELLKKNLIFLDKTYTDVQIIELYESMKQKELDSYEKDIDFMTGSISG